MLIVHLTSSFDYSTIPPLYLPTNYQPTTFLLRVEKQTQEEQWYLEKSKASYLHPSLPNSPKSQNARSYYPYEG